MRPLCLYQQSSACGVCAIARRQQVDYTQRMPRLVFWFLFIFPVSAHAYSGQVIFLNGDVQAGKAAQFEAVHRDQIVQEGETLKTGMNSTAIVKLDDQSLLKLKSNSQITLSKDDSREVRLDFGGLFSNIQKKVKPHFFIRTRTAVMGVRGTRFFTAYGDSGKHENDLWLCVEEGLVAVEALGSREQVLVKEGLGVFVPTGKKVTEPKAYDWTKGLNWNMDPGKGDVVDHTEIKSSYKNLLRQNYD